MVGTNSIPCSIGFGSQNAHLEARFCELWYRDRVNGIQSELIGRDKRGGTGKGLESRAGVQSAPAKALRIGLPFAQCEANSPSAVNKEPQSES